MKYVVCLLTVLFSCFSILHIAGAQTKNIYIDPGHYRGNGARFGKITEEDITLAVALKLYDLLENDTSPGIKRVLSI